MKSEKIVVLFQPHRSYKGSLLQVLVEAIKSTGLEVQYIDITNKPIYKYNKLSDKIRNVYHRKFNKDKQYILKLEAEFYNQYYLEKIKQFKKVNTIKFDYVLIIKPEEFSEKVIKEVISLGNNSVGYIWDGLRLFLKPNILKNRKHLDALYSFDTNNINDHLELAMEFCTNFLIPINNRLAFEERETDLFYIGDLAGTLESQRRDKKLSHFLQDITYNNMDINILFNDRVKKIEKIADSKIKYIESFISIEESLERTRNSKIVIDICKAHHIGLSFRFFECLATETKLITNNKDVVNYDFYNPNNIMVVDFDNDILDENEYISFLEKSYEKVNSSILNKYSIENWIKYLFKEDRCIKISKNK